MVFFHSVKLVIRFCFVSKQSYQLKKLTLFIKIHDIVLFLAPLNMLSLQDKFFANESYYEKIRAGEKEIHFGSYNSFNKKRMVLWYTMCYSSYFKLCVH
tara:strand:+ start:333 stop:629 length:297 start_codon:yes stop_codon:yes gene_type:complete